VSVPERNISGRRQPGSDSSAAPNDLEPRGAGDVRRRAVGAAAVDSLRAIAIRLFALAGTVALTHLLMPDDFGLVAFGLTLTTFAGFLADGGVGTALIRREEAPSRDELRALLGFQLVVNVGLVLLVAVVASPFGEAGAVVAVMALALPIGTIRTPAYITYERRLEYRPLAVIEIGETIGYYVWAVAAVAAGFGVWGLASASVVRAVLGSAAAIALLPPTRIVPAWNWGRVRPLLGFGFRYQAVGFVQMLRDQGVNLAVAVIGGTSMLGLWSVAQRVLQVPFLLFTSLWRVSFPGMSRLVAAGEPVRETIERVVRVTSVVTAFVVAPLAASSWILVPEVFGQPWSDAANAIPPACVGLMLSGPISVALAGYLWAVGDSHIPLRATFVGIAVWAAVMIPLIPSLGVAAVGYGWLFSSIGETLVLISGARRRVQVSLSGVVVPTILGFLSALVGWAASTTFTPSIATGLASAFLAATLYLLASLAFHRRDLLFAARVARRGLSTAIARPA
jgi:O-antigen/teichoic acid export membrane protein